MKRILIVDDDPEIRQSLSFFLEMEGYEYELATNAQEALETVSTVKVDLIILDFMLPKMNGVELCSRLREKSDRIPILMFSADRDIVRKAARCGANDIIKKPFDLDELLGLVQKLTMENATPIMLSEVVTSA